MKSLFLALTALVFSASAYAATPPAPTMEDLSKRAQDAAAVLQGFSRSADTDIPRSLLEKAVCIATFPNVLRAGFVFGARGGQGLVSCRVAGGWSNPVYMTIAGGSWGLQIGVDSTDLVLVFVNPNAVSRVTESKLTLGAGASVSAGPVGRNLAAGTDFTLNSEIYAYGHSRGLYAGLTLDGSVLAVDDEANILLYGHDFKSDAMLRARAGTTPAAALPYVNALKAYAP